MTNKSGIYWIDEEQKRLMGVAKWDAIQKLHDDVIVAQIKFNAALKEYMSTGRS